MRKKATAPKRTARRRDPLAALQQRLQVKFYDPSLLRQALTHRSYLRETQEGESNERLEFLGDSVLGITLAEHLMALHTDWTEGELTKVKAVVVSEPILADVARRLNLGRYVIISRGEEANGGRDRASILSDALEAVFAAVYIDQGMEVARDLIRRLIRTPLRQIERQEHTPDYKTVLQETTQNRLRTTPEYRVAGESGPDHDKTFVIEVLLGGAVAGTGKGKSKQKAEQAAAKAALASVPALAKDGKGVTGKVSREKPAGEAAAGKGERAS